MDIEAAPGMYSLCHVPTGKFYFGASANVRRRIEQHRNAIGTGNHINHGVRANFRHWKDVYVQVTYTDTIEEALKLEQKMLDVFHGWENCCNIASDSRHVSACLAHLRSEKLVGKIDRRFGRVQSAETRAKIGKASHKKTSINGVVYDSMKQAVEALGVPKATINRKINSDKHPDWFYL